MEFQKYNIKEKKEKKTEKKKSQKLLKYIYIYIWSLLLKNSVFFFLRSNIGYKSENERSNRKLKN